VEQEYFFTIFKSLLKMNPLLYQDSLKVKLFPKKLGSGKCQVKFFVSISPKRNLYGYMLVDPEVSLKEVVYEIKQKVNHWPDYAHQEGLYSIGKRKEVKNNIIFFEINKK
jgi:hypothetical protein